MSATIACTGCGRDEGIVAATFRDDAKRTRAALACRFCAVVWPQAIPPDAAAELAQDRLERGVIVVEVAR